jgi:hypothetical protein
LPTIASRPARRQCCSPPRCVEALSWRRSIQHGDTAPWLQRRGFMRWILESKVKVNDCFIKFVPLLRADRSVYAANVRTASLLPRSSSLSRITTTKILVTELSSNNDADDAAVWGAQRCQPVVVGSLPTTGKWYRLKITCAKMLPATAGWQPVLPRCQSAVCAHRGNSRVSFASSRISELQPGVRDADAVSGAAVASEWASASVSAAEVSPLPSPLELA